MRWKALAEIYKMHSFAPLHRFWNPQSKTGEKITWPKQPRICENERPLSSSSLPTWSTSAAALPLPFPLILFPFRPSIGLFGVPLQSHAPEKKMQNPRPAASRPPSPTRTASRPEKSRRSCASAASPGRGTRRVAANFFFFSWQIFGKISLVFGCIGADLCK